MECQNIKVISYNVLSSEIVNDTHDNRNRRRNIIVDRVKPFDIICLQEVPYSETQLWIDSIGRHDAYIAHKPDKKHKSKSMGNVIIWNTDFICVSSETNKSGGVVALLEHYSGYKFIIINVHLKAGLRSNGTTRASQLESCCVCADKFVLMSTLDAHHGFGKVSEIFGLPPITSSLPICICGDFNEELSIDDPPSAIRPRILERGFIIYDTEKSCCIDGGSIYRAFDRVITCSMNIEYKAIGNDISVMIPNSIEPSDHYPLMFTIRY